MVKNCIFELLFTSCSVQRAVVFLAQWVVKCSDQHCLQPTTDSERTMEVCFSTFRAEIILLGLFTQKNCRNAFCLRTEDRLHGRTKCSDKSEKQMRTDPRPKLFRPFLGQISDKSEKQTLQDKSEKRHPKHKCLHLSL